MHRRTFLVLRTTGPSSGHALTGDPARCGWGRQLAGLAVLAALLGGAGCRRLETKDGFPCSATGNECPSTYTCAADHRCYRHPPVIGADGGDTALDAGHADGLDGPAGADVSTNKDALGPDVESGIVAPPGSVETGQPCAVSGDCSSTFCVDGVCCDTACNGLCLACAASYTGKENGTCAPTNGGMDPRDDCQAVDPQTCGNDGWCDGAGACRKLGSNQICAESACAGSMFVATRTCDGAGSCAPSLATDCGTSPCALTGCAAPCAVGSDCGSNAYCDSGTCKVKKTSGDSCEGAAECGSGFCVDGVCCETACTGACLSCSELQTGQKSGKCQPVQAGKDPDDDCATDAPTTCGRDGTCNGSGGCRKYDSTTVCADATCAGGMFTAARRCAAGACPAAAPVDCGQAQCAVEGCRKGCSVDADCSASSYCAGGTCAAKKGNGAACQLGNECTSKACVDDRCCETACTGKCYACAMTKTGQADGKCAPISPGTDPENECANTDKSTCGSDGTCDGAGACRLWSKGTPCADGMCNAAGNYLSARACDGLGTCSPASTDTCAPSVCAATGCKRSCSVDGDCLGNYYCDGTTCAPKKAAGAACGKSSNQCLSNFCVDSFCCDAKCDGKCLACANSKTGQSDGKCAPVPANKDPDNECSKDATKPCGVNGCNGAGACQYAAAGSMCGNASCANPNSYKPASKCDGAGSCLAPSSTQSCPDGLLCDPSMTACKATCLTPSDCVAGNYCLTGKCLPKKAAGVQCNGGTECTSTFCSGDKHCCNAACNASGGCQSCSSGTCSTSSGITACPDTNLCVNTGADPANCGTCGKACAAMTSNNGVPRCSSGNCIPACAQNYMVCDEGGGAHSCVSSFWPFETFTHVPDTCRFGGTVSDEHHMGASSVQLTGAGDPSQSECLMIFADECSSGYFDSFGGANVSVWIKGTLDGQCWLTYDSGQTSMKPVVRGSWTQMSWTIPANATRTASIDIYCDLPDGASWYVDDFLVSQP